MGIKIVASLFASPHRLRFRLRLNVDVEELRDVPQNTHPTVYRAEHRKRPALVLRPAPAQVTRHRLRCLADVFSHGLDVVTPLYYASHGVVDLQTSEVWC